MNTNIKFYLNEGKKASLIMLKHHIDGQRIIYSTGFKIKAEDWGGDMPRQLANRNDLTRLSVNLNTLKINWITAMLDLQSKGIQITKERMIQVINPDKNKVEADVITVGEMIVERLKEQGSRFQSMNNTVNDLKKWKGRVKFDDINSDFYEEIISYYQNKNLALNTIGKHIKNIKQIMNTAVRKKLTTNLDHKDSEFKSMSEKVRHIYLSEEELYQMGTKELPKELDQVRDSFLIGAWSGLRFSDFSRLTTNSIDKFIKIRQSKTRSWVTLPVHPEIRRILTKRNGQLPQTVDIRRMNELLKKVAQLCEINGEFSTEKTIGGKSKVITKKKWELVSTHTARRSVATNMAKRGVPINVIMNITGHSSPAECAKYINLTQEDITTTLANSPFFQGR